MTADVSVDPAGQAGLSPPAATLGRLGRAGGLLMISDGTVTPMLEYLTGERLTTSGLSHSEMPAHSADAVALGSPADCTLIRRTTDLVGAETGALYVRASSVVAVDVLPSALGRDLLHTREPIGRLMRLHRVESRREHVRWAVPDEPEGAVRASRRYRIIVGGIPALLIDESFSAACFEMNG
ncbi:chorismate--pyruvate lyase family protein [Streptomyces pathocidini]|uniref:Chorismate--pyruvate lyase family protein n=1 Tax=Streptomyces pathocidini TaxID=1650571 RepID=A0ABW7UM46_9ACTN|nr:chorismate pyruvate-lyase family protein [Streptomyces pathocidini]